MGNSRHPTPANQPIFSIEGQFHGQTDRHLTTSRIPRVPLPSSPTPVICVTSFNKLDRVHGRKSLDWIMLGPTPCPQAAAEMLVMSYHTSYNLPVVITRGNNVYGPHQFPEKLIPKFILQLRAGLPLSIHGSGTAARSFLYVEDVAKAFSVILERGEIGRIYNISTKVEVSVTQVAADLCGICGVAVEASLAHVADRPHNDAR